MIMYHKKNFKKTSQGRIYEVILLITLVKICITLYVSILKNILYYYKQVVFTPLQEN